jgi:hypothetical protein
MRPKTLVWAALALLALAVLLLPRVAPNESRDVGAYTPPAIHLPDR